MLKERVFKSSSALSSAKSMMEAKNSTKMMTYDYHKFRRRRDTTVTVVTSGENREFNPQPGFCYLKQQIYATCQHNSISLIQLQEILICARQYVGVNDDIVLSSSNLFPCALPTCPPHNITFDSCSFENEYLNPFADEESASCQFIATFRPSYFALAVPSRSSSSQILSAPCMDRCP